MNYVIVAMLSLVLLVTPAHAGTLKRPPPRRAPTKIYISNKSPDMPAESWGGHWNQDVFNACVDLLRVHTDSVALFYHSRGVELVVVAPSSNPRGWRATFKSGNVGGFHTVSNGYPLGIAYTGSLTVGYSPCMMMGEEIAEMLGNPTPGTLCLTTPAGKRIEPELTDPVWGSSYCPQGYEPECSDTVAGQLRGFVLAAWFANHHGVKGVSAELTFPAGIVQQPWETMTSGAYYFCS